ncbi:MAG: hypothetical protein VX730_01785 [Pseudomonadota bacterium]|nr:hypothetical protein [Pseudomonadota bacterium]
MLVRAASFSFVSFLIICFIVFIFKTAQTSGHEWANLWTNVFVGCSLVAFAGLTWRVSHYQSRESNRKALRQNYIRLMTACEKERQAIASFYPDIRRSQQNSPTDEFIMEFNLVKREAELLQEKDIVTYLEPIMEIISVSQDKRRKYTEDENNLLSYKKALNTLNEAIKVCHAPVYQHALKKYK